MKIAIFNLCSPEPSFDKLGLQGEIISRWLSADFPEALFTEVHLADGAVIPQVQDYDGYILSGSEKGVYDSANWLQELTSFLLKLREQRIPVFGICFGHQLMAQAYGGEARKVDHGMVVRSCQYSFADEAGPVIDSESAGPIQGSESLGNTLQVFSANAIHQDQVVRVPPNAQVTVSADYCPVAALDYDFPACSVQFHPEYGSAYMLNAIDNFDGDIVTKSEAQEARNSVDEHSVEERLWAARVAEFFRTSLA